MTGSGESIGLAVAFLAGVLSFLSPCVLPLVPSYVTFLTGLSLDEAGARRWMAVTHALLFICGFTLIFVALGATATGLGRLLNYHQVWLQRGGGALIVLFGIYLLGGFHWMPLERERRFQIQDKPLGYLGSVLVGLAFGAGWTPCIGPILGSILVFTSTQSRLGRGILLLLPYSVGRAIPFLIAAFAGGRFVGWLRRPNRVRPFALRPARACTGRVLLCGGV